MSGIEVIPKLRNLHTRLGASGLLVAGLVFSATLLWVFHIFPAWLHDPDLSHGLFTPLLFCLMLRESIHRGPLNYLPNLPQLTAVVVVVVVIGSQLVLLTGSLYAVATDWGHPFAKFLIGGSVVGLLAAVWIVCATPSVRLIPFNWPAGVAIILWGLSLPVPPGSYHELTLALQLQVTDNVLRALHLLGIPAIQNGNIIDLAHTSVGVEEACSGVRSLMSCIYAGFFFSAAFVRSLPSRLILIILAPILAIFMNFARSLTLTLLANSGRSIEGFWHDSTGYAILAMTAILLAACALLFERIESARSTVIPKTSSPPVSSISNLTSRLSMLIGISCVVGFVWIFSLILLRQAEPTIAGPSPQLEDWLPSEVGGWSVSPVPDLYQFADILETRELTQRSYAKKDSNGDLITVTIYMAYWQPGQTSVSVVATHTPDACWPGAGWVPEETNYRKTRLALSNRKTGQAEYRIFSLQKIPRHVWFWHSYDRRVVEDLDPRRPFELISSVLQYGVRSDGEQLFVRISSNRPWEEIGDDPLFSDLFSNLQAYGI